MFHHFERFLAEYEGRVEKEYGYFRPIVKEAVEKYLDCGNPRCGFACIRCPDCAEERLLMFSCRTRGFCPSCHAKRREAWGEWMREVPEGGMDRAGVFHLIPRIDAARLEEIFARDQETMDYLEFIARVESL